MTSTEVLTSVNSSGAKRKAKYLVFRLENLKFALEILSVEDIFEFVSSTDSKGESLPATCGWDVPIVDLRSGAKVGAKGREGDEEENESERYFVIIVETEARHSRFAIGLVVDRVAEVLDLDAEGAEVTAESKATTASVSRDPTGELMAARILDLDEVLPNVVRFDHHVAGVAAGCAS